MVTYQTLEFFSRFEPDDVQWFFAVGVEQQVADGLEVLGRVVALTMDHSGELLTVASDAAPVGTVQRGKMSRQEAMERAVKAVTATPAGSPPPPGM